MRSTQQLIGALNELASNPPLCMGTDEETLLREAAKKLEQWQEYGVEVADQIDYVGSGIERVQ